MIRCLFSLALVTAFLLCLATIFLSVRSTFRVFRGGSFMTKSTLCRDAARNRNTPKVHIIDNGLRIVVIPRAQ